MLDQIFVPASSHAVPVLQDEDLIGILDGTDSLSYEDYTCISSLFQ